MTWAVVRLAILFTVWNDVEKRNNDFADEDEAEEGAGGKMAPIDR